MNHTEEKMYFEIIRIMRSEQIDLLTAQLRVLNKYSNAIETAVTTIKSQVENGELR